MVVCRVVDLVQCYSFVVVMQYGVMGVVQYFVCWWCVTVVCGGLQLGVANFDVVWRSGVCGEFGDERYIVISFSYIECCCGAGELWFSVDQCYVVWYRVLQLCIVSSGMVSFYGGGE